MNSEIRIEAINEYCLPSLARDQLRDLLDVSFPDTFSGRIYFKQLPHTRLLAWKSQTLVGQVGLDHRVINVAGRIFRIFGIIDLCVAPESRGRGIGSTLLQRAEAMAVDAGLDFILAIADRHDLYQAHGYRRVQPAMAKWLGIEDRNSVMLIDRDLSDSFLVVKTIGDTDWPAGPIDLLGYLF